MYLRGMFISHAVCLSPARQPVLTRVLNVSQVEAAYRANAQAIGGAVLTPQQQWPRQPPPQQQQRTQQQAYLQAQAKPHGGATAAPAPVQTPAGVPPMQVPAADSAVGPPVTSLPMANGVHRADAVPPSQPGAASAPGWQAASAPLPLMPATPAASALLAAAAAQAGCATPAKAPPPLPPSLMPPTPPDSKPTTATPAAADDTPPAAAAPPQPPALAAAQQAADVPAAGPLPATDLPPAAESGQQQASGEAAAPGQGQPAAGQDFGQTSAPLAPAEGQPLPHSEPQAEAASSGATTGGESQAITLAEEPGLQLPSFNGLAEGARQAIAAAGPQLDSAEPGAEPAADAQENAAVLPPQVWAAAVPAAALAAEPHQQDQQQQPDEHLVSPLPPMISTSAS